MEVFLMIPKIIHYCWFGNKEKDAFTLECIKTWKVKCQDYKIIEWNETNCDLINSPKYVQEAYEHKQWAFVSDYFRVQKLIEFGGIYLDTDIEIIRSLDDLLAKHKSFGGFETPNMLQTGVLACEKGNTIFEEFFNYYKNHGFIWGGENATPPNSAILRDIMTAQGLYLNNKYFELAELFLKKAKDVCYVDPEVHFLLAKCYIYKNDIKRAKDALKISIDKGYGYFPAKKLLKEITN